MGSYGRIQLDSFSETPEGKTANMRIDPISKELFIKFADGTTKQLTAGASTGIQADGSVPFTADQSMGNNQLTNVADPISATDAANKQYVDGLVVGLLDDRGSYDASSNLYPATGGSGTAGAILKGDIWYISVPGTLGGTAVVVGDSVRALADAPAQTVGNWDILATGIGFVPENVNNKASDFSVVNNVLYPTVQAVNVAITAKKVTRETPVGIIDGVNTVFTTGALPVVGTEEVFLGGLLQTDTVDYTIAGNTITFVVPPPALSILRVNYYI